MAFDLATAKKRLGIEPGDTSQDEMIASAMNATIALAEKFCFRKFFYEGDVAKFYFESNRRFYLDRYPIDEVVTVVSEGGTVPEYKLNHSGGWLDFNQQIYFDELEIQYKGGYQNSDLPADIELAFWEIFDDLYAVQSGEGKGVGELQSMTIPDVGTLRYNTSQDGSIEGQGYLSASVVQILTAYKRVYA